MYYILVSHLSMLETKSLSDKELIKICVIIGVLIALIALITIILVNKRNKEDGGNKNE